jgi:hypothetical protein
MKSHRFQRIVLLVACFCLAALAVFSTVGRSWIEDLLAEPAPTSPPVTVEADLTAEEQAFYDTVLPRMLVVAAEAQVLAEMGRTHSRNILELQTRGDRVNENASRIEAYATEHGVPGRFLPAYQQFSEGVVLLRRAMNDSRQGMLSFDWDKVAASIGIFEAGQDAVSIAVERIQQSASEATPTME